MKQWTTSWNTSVQITKLSHGSAGGGYWKNDKQLKGKLFELVFRMWSAKLETCIFLALIIHNLLFSLLCRTIFSMEAIEILGLTAGSISGITFIPQVIKTWKTKSADDISLLMFTFATLSVVMWLVYGIIKKDIAIIYTNSLVLICSLIMLYFKFRFSSKKDREVSKVKAATNHEN